jgi:hypothetical protein
VRDVSSPTVDLKILKAVMERIANHGMKAEALYVSKLGVARIIPTAEQKIRGDETAQSLANQSAVISNGGWRVAAWAISYAGISRDGLMLPLRLRRLAAEQIRCSCRAPSVK